MKIFIVCSKHFYHLIPPIAEALEKQGHSITFPNSYDEPFKEEEVKQISEAEHREWKANMMKQQEPKVKANDALLVLNFEKKGVSNYIGGATFLEIYKGFELGKKIFLYNPIPDNIFTDELRGIGPTVIDGDLTRVQ